MQGIGLSSRFCACWPRTRVTHFFRDATLGAAQLLSKFYARQRLDEARLSHAV